MLTLRLAGLKSLKIVTKIDESFLLKVCETVRNRVADADLQDRCVHPDDFASVYLNDSHGGYQDYARLNHVNHFRHETFAESQALFILKEYRTQKLRLKLWEKAPRHSLVTP